MKKFTLIFIALLAATLAVQAQDRREIKAVSGSAYVAGQGSYTPSFKNDGSNPKARNASLSVGDGRGPGAATAASASFIDLRSSDDKLVRTIRAPRSASAATTRSASASRTRPHTTAA